jgi:hypothetical protein
MKFVGAWALRRKRRIAYQAWKDFWADLSDKRKNAEFVQAFVARGRLQRSFRSFKLFAQVAGNRMYWRRLQEKITIEV